MARIYGIEPWNMGHLTLRQLADIHADYRELTTPPPPPPPAVAHRPLSAGPRTVAEYVRERAAGDEQ